MASRVLVVDDDRDVLALLDEVLGDAGYAVSTATDGEEGLRAAVRDRPDVILLDLMMPNVSGWRFLELYRHAPAPHAAVVVVSALRPEALDLGRLAGADAVVPKPFGLDQLLAVVNRCLHAHERRRIA